MTMCAIVSLAHRSSLKQGVDVLHFQMHSIHMQLFCFSLQADYINGSVLIHCLWYLCFAVKF